MPKLVRLAAAAVIGVIAIGAVYFNLPGSGGVGGEPTSSPPPTAAPTTPPTPSSETSPIAAPIPSLTETFDSANGYSIGMATGMTVEKTDSPSGERDAFDAISTDLYILRAGSVLLPSGVDVDTFIDSNLTVGTPVECGAKRAELPDVVIDGHAGKIRDACGDVEATVVVDGRAYLFTLYGLGPTTNPRAIFDAFAATIQLHPEDAVLPSPSPS